MPFSGNFTRVTLGADPEAGGGRAIFVEGRTDDAADPPLAIHIVLPHDGQALTATVVTPTLIDWEVKFPEGNPPFNEGDDVFVVGVATRPAPHDPFVWEGSFTLTSRDFP
jgi:hypothetical protein